MEFAINFEAQVFKSHQKALFLNYFLLQRTKVVYERLPFYFRFMPLIGRSIINQLLRVISHEYSGRKWPKIEFITGLCILPEYGGATCLNTNFR